MRNEVFIDASAWIAVFDRGDQYHEQAATLYRRLIAARRFLVTTNLVIAESQITIRRAGGFAASRALLDSLRLSSRLERVYSTAALELEAEKVLRQFSDHELSLADAVSFVLMRQRKITEAFTYDKHFSMAGFIQLE